MHSLCDGHALSIRWACGKHWLGVRGPVVVISCANKDTTSHLIGGLQLKARRYKAVSDHHSQNPACVWPRSNPEHRYRTVQTIEGFVGPAKRQRPASWSEVEEGWSYKTQHWTKLDQRRAFTGATE